LAAVAPVTVKGVLRITEKVPWRISEAIEVAA